MGPLFAVIAACLTAVFFGAAVKLFTQKQWGPAIMAVIIAGVFGFVCFLASTM